MKKKFFKGTALLLTLASLASCGGNSDTSSNSNDKPAPTEIVIYAGGSSEYSWSKGSEEADAIRYIQDKYYEDTGRNLKFNVSYLGQDMKTKIQSTIASGGTIDICISHTKGGDGIDDYVLKNNLYRDITDDMYDYAPNLLEFINGEPKNSLTNDEGKVIGIPSNIDGKNYGILVRKDWMKECGYTDDPNLVDQGYELVDNLETFEAMCLSMKQKYNLGHVISGAVWDLEKVLTVGAYGNAGYFKYGFRDGKVVPGFCTEEYKKTIELEYKWASQGIYSQEWQTISLEQGETNFIGSKTGVFVLDPSIEHLIKVSRKCKSVNKDAEFAVLGALSENKESTKKGFLKNSPASFAACILNTSNKSRQIMQFVNWMYQSEENYNICKYGIPGTHWVDNGDGTYSFPEGKESYLTNAPYSGILSLVENQARSGLTYKGYSDEEKSWISTAKDPNNYFENELNSYMWPMTNSQVNSAYSNAISPVYGSCIEYWNATAPSSRTHDFDSEINTFMTSVNGKLYIDFINQAYGVMKQLFGK